MLGTLAGPGLESDGAWSGHRPNAVRPVGVAFIRASRLGIPTQGRTHTPVGVTKGVPAGAGIHIAETVHYQNRGR
jgi:hypothetical protein